MPHSAATVRLAPIIKTNHAQALALDMHMIQQLHNDSVEEEQQQREQQLASGAAVGSGAVAGGQQQQQSGQSSKPFRPLNSGQTVNTAYSSPQLSQRQRSLVLFTRHAAPYKCRHQQSERHTVRLTSRQLATAVNSHRPTHTLIYTFPNPPPINEESDTHSQQQQPNSASQAEVEPADSFNVSPSAASLPSPAPLHLTVSASAVSDHPGTDTLLSPGPLQPSSSYSQLSSIHSPHAALHSPVSFQSDRFAPSATSPLLSPTTAANAANEETATATTTTASHTTEVAKSLSFADSPDYDYASSVGSVGLSAAAPMLCSATSAPGGSSTSLSTPLVVPATGLTSRKQFKLSTGIPVGQSLLRHCLPCLPVSSAASSPSHSASTATRSAAASRRQSRQSRQSRRRRASGDDGCCSNLVTCNPLRLSFRFTLVCSLYCKWWSASA